MATVTFHLVSLGSADSDSFVSSLRALPESQRPLWLGQVHHWLHEPQISAAALLGTGSHIKKWEYILVSENDLPAEVESQLSARWSITADSPEDMPSLLTKQSRSAQAAPSLPGGWSPEDHSGLDASVAPQGLHFSLDLRSRTLGAAQSTDGKTVRDFVREFGTAHPGPVIMFNLLSYLPEGRPIYLGGYIGGFMKEIGPMYGGEALQFASGATAWSSQADEQSQDGVWEDAALVWYPSLWHFAKMVDDPVYIDLDRKFKPVSLRDNPLACCTEIEL